MVHPFFIDKLQIRDDIIWKKISSILIWVLWKAQYAPVFDNVTRDVFAIIHEFWLLFIHTLRGQHEHFTWNFDVIFRKRIPFKRLWDWMLIFGEDGCKIRLMYTVLIILGNDVY